MAGVAIGKCFFPSKTFYRMNVGIASLVALMSSSKNFRFPEGSFHYFPYKGVLTSMLKN